MWPNFNIQQNARHYLGDNVLNRFSTLQNIGLEALSYFIALQKTRNILLSAER